MTKENRFEGLMGAVGKSPKSQTSKQSNVQTSKTRKKSAEGSDVEPSKQLNVSTSEQPDIQTVKRSDAQTSNQPNIQPAKKAKSANPDYTRTTVYLPKKMHKQLKARALDEEREMSSIVEELIDTWLSNRK